ncbi:hypothetical protein [Flagellimonas marinaquae]
MKRRKPSLPTPVNYDDLTEVFSGKLTKLKRFHPSKSNDKFNLLVEEKREDLLQCLEKHKEVIDEIEDKIVEFMQYSIARFPDVYVARTTNKQNDQEYFTAKTFIPQKGGKRKEVKVYVGKAEDFHFDTKNLEAKKQAIDKMKKTLIRRLDEGTI